MRTIRTQINGRPLSVEVPDNRLLIDMLRVDLRMTGTKESCSVGVCGACTVLLDGMPVSACLTLAVYAENSEIETIEGLADGDALHPVQQAFVDYGGYQCGICTPGQIMAAKALLEQNARPSRTEIQYWMMGNICRCTGYYKIIDAIEAAAKNSVA
jgi:aerobic-type carbon monoxide dehydrogenase small subunit (CoxS/CutS family)